MRPIATDVAHSVLCLCLSVPVLGTRVSCAKTDHDTVWGWLVRILGTMC